VINRTLLPRELRPGIVPTLSLLLGGLFFWMLGIVTLLNALREAGWVTL